MEPNNLQQQPMGADQEIDLIELAQKLWQGRRMIVKWCLAGALAGLVIGFSIPKEYTVTVKLAPEIQGGKTSLGGLSSLASMAGINVGSMNSADAMSPELYPDIVQSVPFMTELFDVEVADRKGLTAMPSGRTFRKSCGVRGGARCLRLRSRRWGGSWGCSARRNRRMKVP